MAHQRMCLCAIFFSFLIFGTAMASDTITADGIVLINQDIATKGKILPGDDPGFPVTITKPGSYRLSSNLTVQDKDTTAILIDANDVTLDLNGFTIAGPVVCNEFGVCNPTGGTGIGVHTPLDVNLLRRNTVVRNGIITGMGSHGIFIRQGIVEKVIVAGNGGIGIWQEHGGMLLNNIVDSNGSVGINGGGLVIAGNRVIGNAGDGIDAGTSVVNNNSVAQNGAIGIQGSICTVIGNVMVYNTSYGLDGGAYGHNLIFGNNGNADPQVNPLGGFELQIDTDQCGSDTTCP